MNMALFAVEHTPAVFTGSLYEIPLLIVLDCSSWQVWLHPAFFGPLIVPKMKEYGKDNEEGWYNSTRFHSEFKTKSQG